MTTPELQVVPAGPLSEELLEQLFGFVVSDGSEPPLTVLTPFTGEVLAEVPVSSDADVAGAYAIARDAQRRWARVPVAERKRIMLRFHDLLMQRRDQALDIVQFETGRIRYEALQELLDVCGTARYYARSAEGLLRTRNHLGAVPFLVGVKEHRHPKGVVSVIAPWNYPLIFSIADAIPAIMAGNAVVLKPDSSTPLIALFIAQVMRDAGLPEGVLQYVVGAGRRIGPIMVERGDFLMFTGSTATGRILAGMCGQQLQSSSMELGGKNAIIICEDADLDKAAEIAERSCFMNSGQACVSNERMLVHASVYDAFMERFLQRVRNMHMAPGLNWDATMGSLISQEQLNTVTAFIDDAIDKGATVLAGGRPRPDVGPYYFEPTVLTDVTEAMDLCRSEVFGPVVSVSSYTDIEHAIETVNDTEYGLSAAIVSRDTKRANEIAKRLRTGTVNINEDVLVVWGSTRSTQGGMGASGMGRRHGAEGLLKYTEPQTVGTMRILGTQPQFGASTQQWGAVLTAFYQTCRKVGMK